MSQYLSDRLYSAAGQALSSHVADVGGAWLQDTLIFSGGSAYINAGASQAACNGSLSLYRNPTLAGASTQQVDLICAQNGIGDGVIFLGCDFDCNGTGYLVAAQENAGSPNIVLARYNGGVIDPVLQQTVAHSSWSAPQTLSISLDSSGVLRALINGVVVASFTDPGPLVAGMAVIGGRDSLLQDLVANDTAITLTLPTASATTQSTGALGVTTDTAGGTLYWRVDGSPSAAPNNPPSSWQSQAVGSAGPQTIAAAAIPAGAALYAHFVQVLNGQMSEVVTAGPFWFGVDLSSAFSRVLPYAKGCPDPTVMFHLQQAAIEFFQKTLAWNVALLPVPTVCGQTDYTLPVPAGADVVRLLRYRIDDGCGNWLNDGRGSGLVDEDMGHALLERGTCVYAAWTTDRVSFMTTPEPIADGQQMALTVALKPTQASTAIPAVLFEQFIQHISNGALAGILNVPGQPFSNPQRAAMAQAMFYDAIASVSSQVAKAFGRSKQRSKPFLF